MLSVVHAAAIEDTNGPVWLVESLWAQEGVGILGGSPKSCKTWLAMELAISVATGTPALKEYPVHQPGPVLLFAAEDSPTMIRNRLSGLAARRGLRLEACPIHVIVERTLRLDRTDDTERLDQTVAHYRPRLLILDPFVRLHRLDENSALEVSGVLAYLRELQRRHQVSILVVHHARKAGSSSEQMGLSLRGSGDLHAWGDSNLYLRRRKGVLDLIVEHRNARAPEPVSLELRGEGEEPVHLEIVRAVVKTKDDADLRTGVVELLEQHVAPLRQDALRARLEVRTERVVAALRHLDAEGIVRRTSTGWTLASPSTTESGDAETEGGDTPVEE